ncbi:MAG: ABC transporter ATP-binding protein [Anaerolineae bacterium]|jgi:branched-chain amino acid transport system ATP-binding protein|nr:ABC transporter ATP-binding protein [Anaerolineae bacterium]
MSSLLEIRNLNVAYGGVHALRGITLHVDEGEVVTMIGANGAGKSTLLNAISAIVKIGSGDLLYNGEPLPRRPHQVVTKGVVQVPEGRQVFANLTVQENLQMGAFLRSDAAGIAKDFERIYAIFPRLEERKKQYAGSLSGGEQQMLAIGRGLMSRPKLMLLDEPSLGLAPLLVQEIFRVIKEINNEGVTILLVEQNARKALSVANRAYVLETGDIIREGSGMELLKDPVVQEAYLGARRAAA